MSISIEIGMQVQKALNSVRNGEMGEIETRQHKGVTTIEFMGEVIASYEGRKSRESVMRRLVELQAEHHATVHALIADTLKQVDLPADHAFDVGSCSMLGGIASSQSCFVGFLKNGPGFPECLNAEFRIFMDSPRAHLFMTYGRQCNFESIKLTRDKEAYFYADSYEALAEDLLQRFNHLITRIPEAKRVIAERASRNQRNAA